MITFAPTAYTTYTESVSLTYTNGHGGSAKTVSVSLSATGARGTAGTIDTQAFGTSGLITQEMTPSYSLTYNSVNDAAVQQPDGKWVTAGYYALTTETPYPHPTGDFEFAVMRYLSDGTLDTSFGTAGKVSTDLGCALHESYAHAIALDSAGKIVVAGHCEGGGGNSESVAVARFLSDGSLDTTFNSTGKKTFGFGSNRSFAHAVAIQSDDKIVVGGYTTSGSPLQFALARLTTAGTLDTTFDTDGKVQTTIGSTSNIIYALSIDSSGRILAAGYTKDSGTNDMIIARYATDGSLDTTFNSTGYHIVDVASGNDYAFALAQQSDGKVIVSGIARNGSIDDMAVLRFDTSGTLDTSFDGDGIALTSFASSVEVRTVTLQSDGKIVVVGSKTGALAVARYNSDGSLDTSLNSAGTATPTSSVGRPCSALLQSDGRLVIVGSMNEPNYDFTDTYMYFTRLWL